MFTSFLFKYSDKLIISISSKIILFGKNPKSKKKKGREKEIEAEKKKDKPMTYSIIPNEVLHDNELKPITRLLYADICSLSNLEGYCFAMNRYFAKLYDKTPVTISRSIKELKERGYIEIRYTYKEKSAEIETRKITPLIKIDSTPYKKSIYPHIKNDKDNNIKNNNIIEYIYKTGKSEIEADRMYFEDNPMSEEEVIMLMSGED